MFSRAKSFQKKKNILCVFLEVDKLQQSYLVSKLFKNNSAVEEFCEKKRVPEVTTK